MSGDEAKDYGLIDHVITSRDDLDKHLKNRRHKHDDKTRGYGNDNLFCSFCGKNQKEVKKLIAGPPFIFVMNVFNSAVKSLKRRVKKTLKKLDNLWFPKEIKADAG